MESKNLNIQLTLESQIYVYFREYTQRKIVSLEKRM